MAILERVRALQDLKNAYQPLPNNIPHMAIAIAKDTMEANQVEQLWNTRWGDASTIAYHSQVGAFELRQRMQRLKTNHDTVGIAEGGVRVCGIAVLGYFWCGVAVIIISKYGIAVFRVQAVCGEFKFYVAVVGEKKVVSR